MNKTYRIIWSETHQAFVVANEKAATRGKPSSTRKAVAQAVVAALLALAAPAALAGTSCPGLGGAITVTGADDQTCDLVTGDSLTVNLGGRLRLPPLASRRTAASRWGASPTTARYRPQAAVPGPFLFSIAPWEASSTAARFHPHRAMPFILLEAPSPAASTTPG